MLYIKKIMTSNEDNIDLSGVTFVTCFYHIYKEEPFQYKNVPWRIEQFEFIASLGVNICLYGCETTTPFLEECIRKFPNVKLLTLDIPYTETPIYKTCMQPDLTLPERRYDTKDNVEYMTLMNSKIEFVYDAIMKNPWNSRVFSWMDFSMAYVFGNKGESLPYLKRLSERNFIDKFMAFPGCWYPIPPNNPSAIINNIHWRFCGTFFIGDKESLLYFHKVYREHFPRFIEETKKLVWEVNIWAWLEANTDANIRWFSSDHNDRIIQLPEHFFKQEVQIEICEEVIQDPLQNITLDPPQNITPEQVAIIVTEETTI